MTYRTVLMASMLLVSQVTAQPGPQPLPQPVGGRAAQVIAPQFVIQPSKTIEVTLENARNAEAKCFLDLDTGKVLTFGESQTTDGLQSERFVLDSGIDIKSDTDFPGDGFAMYELMLIPTKAEFDSVSDYQAVLDVFKDRPAPVSLRLESVGPELPQRYIFKTASGGIGALEIIEKTTAPNGLKLTFKVIPKPEPVLALGRGRGARAPGRLGRGGIAVAGAPPIVVDSPAPGGRRGGPATAPHP